LIEQKNELPLLKEKYDSLEIFECEMTHEKVKFDINGHPIRKDEVNFERNCLCSTEIRNKRLGCGHTTSRIQISHSLDKIKTFLQDQENISLMKKNKSLKSKNELIILYILTISI